jgi:hypothetical protein
MAKGRVVSMHGGDKGDVAGEDGLYLAEGLAGERPQIQVFSTVFPLWIGAEDQFEKDRAPRGRLNQPLGGRWVKGALRVKEGAGDPSFSRPFSVGNVAKVCPDPRFALGIVDFNNGHLGWVFRVRYGALDSPKLAFGCRR